MEMRGDVIGSHFPGPPWVGGREVEFGKQAKSRRDLLSNAHPVALPSTRTQEGCSLALFPHPPSLVFRGRKRGGGVYKYSE